MAGFCGTSTTPPEAHSSTVPLTVPPFVCTTTPHALTVGTRSAIAGGAFVEHSGTEKQRFRA